MEYVTLIKALEGALIPTTMASAAMVYKTYKTFRVPKQISHFPEVSILALISSFVKEEGYDERVEKLMMPALGDKGYLRMWAQGRWEVVVADIKHAREVLEQQDKFLKLPVDDDDTCCDLMTRKLLKESIQNTNNEERLRQRQVAEDTFKNGWSTWLAGEGGLEILAKLQDHGKGPFMIHELFQKMSIDTLGKYLMSHNFEAVKKGDGGYYLPLYQDVMEAVYNPFYYNFPFLENWIPGRKPAHKKCEELRDFIAGLVEKRKAELQNGADRSDLLSLLIKSYLLQEDSSLSQEDVISDITSFMVSGNETTSNVLATVVYYLSKHQSCQEKVRQEVLNILGNSREVCVPTGEQLQAMTYLDCVLKESMRILPPIHRLRRFAPERAPLSNGLTIPKESFVSVNLFALFRDPSLFPYPEEFNPERFVDSEGPQNGHWMAFGCGPQMCMGEDFAMMIQKVTLSMLLQKYIMHLGPHSRSQKKPSLPTAGPLYPTQLDIEFISRF